ncbi:MAG: YCF48-related protein [Bacteroidales bacterium]
MKKLSILTAFLLYFFTFTSFAQWEFQNPIPTNATLNDVQFIDENKGWAVGEYLTIIHTADGGDTWVEQITAADDLFYEFSKFNAVHFSDENNGWAVGQYYMPYGGGYWGLAFRTEDGGETWEIVYPDGTYYNFNDVYFINNMEGWIIDEDGKIIYTNDGGNNFTIQYDDSTKVLRSFCFIDGNNGWVTGNEGLIIHTTDGGIIWDEQTSGVSINLSSVCFIDELKGWAAGEMETWPPETKILQTTDGGNSWQINYEFANYDATDIGTIFFTDSDNGWFAYRAYYYSTVFRTTDGGETWFNEYVEWNFNLLSSIYFLDNSTGWMIGENVILKTINSGQTWEPQNSVSNAHFSSVSFVDENTGWAIGTRLVGGIPNFNNYLAHTSDGGNSWQVELLFEPYGWVPFGEILFKDDNHGWIIGYNSVQRTDNGGLTWQTASYQGGNPLGIFFINLQTGWIVSENGMILISTDGGEYWEEQTSGTTEGLFDIYFIDEDNGWIVGDNRIVLHTSDGGVNWETLSLSDEGMLHHVQFIDDEQGWAIGEWDTHFDMVSTEDGGETWEEIYSSLDMLMDFHFTDLLHGWAVGEKGLIIYTDDGGINWNEQFHGPAHNLRSIGFVDDQNAWVVGNYGTILNTDNGGIVGKNKFEVRSSVFEVLCYPNPFSNQTTIEFSLTKSEDVTLSIYDITGKLIEVILSKKMQQGEHKINWNSASLEKGIYFFELKTNPAETGQTTKMIKL